VYIRTISRKNRNGAKTSYVQLAHNVRDESGVPQAKALYTFGRLDTLDIEAIRRLIASLSRFVSPDMPPQDSGPMVFARSAPMGGAYLLRSLWEKMGIPGLFSKILKDRNFSSPIEWGPSLPWSPTAPLPPIRKEGRKSG
jgi:hypothetical protein